MKKMNDSVYLMLLLLFFSCGKSKDNSNSASGNLTPSLGDYQFLSDFPNELEASEVFKGENLTDAKFILLNAPSFLTINEDTGLISGIPTHRALHELIKVRATKNDQVIDSPVFSLGVIGDPLREEQWHLENLAQQTFSESQGTEGEDIKIKNVWHQGYTGKGISIAISDTGLETNHEDLKDNLLADLHKDYSITNTSSPLNPDLWKGDPTPLSSGHGTSVAGIIGAVGWNETGGTGVAPNAKMAGLQFLYSNQSSSIVLDQASGPFDIFNYSYGDENFFDQQSLSLYVDHLRYQVNHERNNRGPIYLKSAGNEYQTCKTNYMEIPLVCTPHNANIPLENEIPFIMVVGAVNANGVKSSYSNVGSNIWVVAPGGEFGDDAPAILTTDWSTCTRGYSKSSASTNLFEYNHPLNPSCDYTSLMNGTSSATPMVAGIIALLLEARPELTWRDVRHILALTADRVDPEHGVQDHPTSILRLTDHDYEQGWVENKAGIKFNNWYGFGRVNAAKALEMTLDNYQLLPPLIETNPDFDQVSWGENGLSLAIPDADKDGVVITFSVAQERLIETIQLKISVTHPVSGQVGIEMISPEGTRSILLNINNSLLMPSGVSRTPDSNLTNLVLTTHAFYGESSKGNWQIKFIDGLAGETGVVTKWSANFLTH